MAAGEINESVNVPVIESSVIRIGKIRYTNSLPFYHNLRKFEFAFEYFENCPAEINLAMREKRVDVAPISSLEYLQRQEDYVLLPELGIVARAFSGSVILFSKEKIDKLNGGRIALSRESLSSVTLLRILLKLKYKFDNEFDVVDSNPEEMLTKYPAALVIGDDALFYQPKEFVYKYDLSELWWNWTEKPFCFALWATRREYAQQHPQELSVFCRAVKRNTHHNLADIENLIKQALGYTFIEDKFSKIFGYLFNLNYALDSDVLDGLELFYRLAHRMKLAPRPEPLEFFEPVHVK